MSATSVPAGQQLSTRAGADLRCRVRLADGRTFAGALPVQRHRALQIGLLHLDTDGLVELAAGSRRDGRLQITTRRRVDHYLPGGRAGEKGWLPALLTLGHATRPGRGGVPRPGAARSAPAEARTR